MRVLLLILLYIVIIISNVFSQEKPRIGLSLADLVVDRWKKDRDQIIAEGNKSGYEVLATNADNSADKQLQQVVELIDSGIKLLILVAVDANQAALIVNKAHQAGIKVIAYDRLINNCNVDAYITFDNELVGEFMAIYMLNRYPSGNFAYIGGPVSDNNTYFIHKGILESLMIPIESGNIHMVLDTNALEWTSEAAYKIMSEYFSANRKQPIVVFAANDKLAEGIIQALEKKRLVGIIKVTGQDAELEACRYIVEGKQALTIYKPIRNLAEITIKTADNFINNRPIKMPRSHNNNYTNVPTYFFNPVPVDKDNLRVTVIEDKFQKEEDVYK